MRWLFDQLRPRVDESALLEDIQSGKKPEPVPLPPLGKVLVASGIITVLGIAFMAGAWLIGYMTGWQPMETISTNRGAEIWAWVPMLLMGAAGAAITFFGIRHAVQEIPYRRRRSR